MCTVIKLLYRHEITKYKLIDALNKDTTDKNNFHEDLCILPNKTGVSLHFFIFYSREIKRKITDYFTKFQSTPEIAEIKCL
jgi:hypothetical protein